MNSLNKLEKLFSEFPGIGPRQARRFVYFLLTKNGAFLTELVGAISNLKKEITVCTSCFRFFTKNKGAEKRCSHCLDSARAGETLMIVSRDIDFENIEKTGTYKGMYFVLGGLVPILEKEPEKKIRINELLKKIEEQKKIIKEVILALNANSEGENTTEYVISKIKKISDENSITISTLGRGLSTGLELEYSDSETLKNALKNRS